MFKLIEERCKDAVTSFIETYEIVDLFEHGKESVTSAFHDFPSQSLLIHVSVRENKFNFRLYMSRCEQMPGRGCQFGIAGKEIASSVHEKQNKCFPIIHTEEIEQFLISVSYNISNHCVRHYKEIVKQI